MLQQYRENAVGASNREQNDASSVIIQQKSAAQKSSIPQNQEVLMKNSANFNKPLDETLDTRRTPSALTWMHVPYGKDPLSGCQ